MNPGRSNEGNDYTRIGFENAVASDTPIFARFRDSGRTVAGGPRHLALAPAGSDRDDDGKHETIVEAIRAQDADGAGFAMRWRLSPGRKRLMPDSRDQRAELRQPGPQRAG